MRRSRLYALQLCLVLCATTHCIQGRDVAYPDVSVAINLYGVEPTAEQLLRHPDWQAVAVPFRPAPSARGYWLRAALPELAGGEFLLTIPAGTLDRADVYFVDRGVVRESFRGGRTVPLREQAVAHRFPVVPLRGGRAPAEVLIHIRSINTIIFRLELWNAEAFARHDRLAHFFTGALLALLIVMSVYNSFLYFSLRDPAYLYYTLYVLMFFAYQAELNGVTAYAFPDAPAWRGKVLVISTAAGCLAVTMFFRSFLREAPLALRLRRSIDGLVLLSAVFLSVGLFVTSPLLNSYANLHVTVFILILVISSGQAAWRGYRPARLLVVSWLVMFFGSLIFALRNLGILPSNVVTDHAIQTGAALEVILVSLALADRINVMKSQLAAANADLEDRVTERTSELKITLDELTKRDTVMQLELDLASRLQQNLLPASPSLGRLKINAGNRSFSRVGGDFYDSMVLPDGRECVLIADVSGHGLPAALITTMLKVLFLEATRTATSIPAILDQVNTALLPALPGHDYATFFLIVLSPNGTLEYCGGAHPDALLLRRGSRSVERLNTNDVMLGMFSNEDLNREPGTLFRSGRSTVAGGDRLLLYTDGIVEALNEEQEEYQSVRLESSFVSARDLSGPEVYGRIFADFDAFLGSRSAQDDVTVLVVEVQDMTGK